MLATVYLNGGKVRGLSHVAFIPCASMMPLPIGSICSLTRTRYENCESFKRLSQSRLNRRSLVDLVRLSPPYLVAFVSSRSCIHFKWTRLPLVKLCHLS